MAAQQPRPLDNLIKPDQVYKIPINLTRETRDKYHHLVTTCWQRLQSRPPGSPEYQEAMERLGQFSDSIKAQMRKFQQQRAGLNQQPNLMRPQNQPQMPQPRQPTQQSPNQNQQPGPGLQHPNAANRMGMSAKVVETVRNFQYVAPPTISNGNPNNVSEYINEARQRHAKALQAYENCNEQLQKLEQVKTDKLAQQNSLTPQDELTYNEQKEKVLRQREEARNFIQKFVEAQNKLKADMGLLNQGGPAAMKRDPSQNGIGQGNQGQPHTVSSAINAIRSQSDASETGKPNISGSAIPGGGQAQVNQPNNTPQMTQGPQTQSSTQVKSEDRSSDPTIKGNQPNATAQTPSSTSNFPETMQRNPSFTAAGANNSFTPNGPQSTPHAHPAHPRIPGAEQSQIPAQQHHNKLPIAKDLSIAAPTSVPMGPSRPTLAGGPIPAGPIGQPAIVRHPGYVLEGDGERVLSKKKLEELFRQVTGSTGTDIDESEMLSPDVEETLLQVADDFVDQVISSACKLAKLRQSATLDLRDIQLILERNYNIRVPGYASDEVRAVRKVVPTTGWTQKLSAVQAAKVTGGKRE